MKKIFYYLLPIVFLITGCSDEPSNSEEQPGEGEPIVYNVFGVWEDVEGNFISFGKDGYFCMYMGNIEKPTIQSGNYGYVPGCNRLECSNPYFGTNTKFSFEDFSEKNMDWSITYYTIRSEIRFTGGTFSKTNKVPAEKENPLIGRSYTTGVRSSSGDFLWNQTTEFLTYNSGKITADQGNAKKYPKTFYYFYFDGKIYYQEFADAPTIGAWTSYTNTGDIFCAPVTIKPNGTIQIGATDRLTK